MGATNTATSSYSEKLTHSRQFYIDGKWVDAVAANDYAVINPSTEEKIATISLGGQADVDNAVAAANQAFESYSETSINDRIDLLQRIIKAYRKNVNEMAEIISVEMGAPMSLSQAAQAPSGMAHFSAMLEVLRSFQFEELKGTTLMRKEPVGVCGLITPWNWPVNQIACKVAPALAAGCTVVLKPSEIAPLSACLFAEIMDEAGVPAGVFNMVHGNGSTVGAAIASHPGIAMVSFTGSTRAGIDVARRAASTVKRVTQELGGKSANIILDDADMETAVTQGVQACFRNSGQSCNAPTRMLVPRSRSTDAAAIARKAAEQTRVGNPFDDKTDIGPLVSQTQYDKVQRLIQAGIDEGAVLVAGGTGRPEGITAGYFVKPTVFAEVTNDMTVAREEIFGPVICIISYSDENEAVAIANDTEYGLSAYVTSSNRERARHVANRLRAGNIHINYARLDFASCFGGYKQSGNGREWGEAGLNEFLELKAVLGFD